MHTGRALAGILPLLPRSILWAVAKRYVAGSTLEDALRVTAELTERNRLVTLDVLGEQFSSREQVMLMTAEYERALGELEHDHPSATLSVMMTGFGLRLDPRLCWENLRRLAKDAADRAIGLTLNMEDSSTVDATLDVYRRLRAEGFDAVGIVLQSCLRRTLDDLAALAHLRPRVRIVKGIWHEPESVAFQGKREVDKAYVRALKVLMAGEGYPMLATHDPRLIAIGEELARRENRGYDSYEFQMLYGIRPHEQERIAATGQRMRVYVPYGDEWYAYLMRRLAEKPANLALFLRSTLTKG